MMDDRGDLIGRRIKKQDKRMMRKCSIEDGMLKCEWKMHWHALNTIPSRFYENGLPVAH